MVRRLLRAKRDGGSTHYSLDHFDEEIRRMFDVREKNQLPSGTRTLYHLTPL